MNKWILLFVLSVIAMSSIGAKNLRKPIAIANGTYRTTVICNDGTIWEKPLVNGDAWYRLPDIPQE